MVLKQCKPCTVQDVEDVLFALYPKRDAFPWDKVGLSVGWREAEVTGIACALDVTYESIRQAQEQGCNVLVTHHPIFLEPPFPVEPAKGHAISPAASLYEAIQLGVHVISMHTNLDRSVAAARKLPDMLGLEFEKRYEKRELLGIKADLVGKLGALSRIRKSTPYAQIETDDTAKITLDDLAKLCKKKFGRVSQVWGDPDSVITRVLSATGSWGGLDFDPRKKEADVIICGECKYHEALDLNMQGVSLILLGHDTSELPLVMVLHQTLQEALITAGFTDTARTITTLPEPMRWYI